MSAKDAMGKALGGAICGLALVTLSMRVSIAGPAECRDAVDQYTSAKSDVTAALRIYASCVSGSDGHDDCSSEFLSLSRRKRTSNPRCRTMRASASNSEANGKRDYT